MSKKKFNIYAIDIDGLVYVGSTNDMKRRLKDHRTRCFNPKSKHYTCKMYTYIRSKYTREEAYVKINNGHAVLYTVDNKEEARIAEQEYITTMGTLNGRMEINNISNAERCKLNRKKIYKEARNREKAYNESDIGKKKRAEYRANNKERSTEKVTCECGINSTRKHISDHRRAGKCSILNNKNIQ